MEENQIWSRTQVLERIPELLDTILSFVTSKDLVQTDQVCQFWRSRTERSLKRRLHVTEARVFEKWHAYALFVHDREPNLGTSVTLDAPPPPIPAELHPETDIRFRKLIKDSGLPIERALALKTLLTFDWAQSIHSLSLDDGTVTVPEWNLIGRYLLSRLKNLRYLWLSMNSKRESIWSSESSESSVPEVDASAISSGVQKLEVSYSLGDQELGTGGVFLNPGFYGMCRNVQYLQASFFWKKGTNDAGFGLKLGDQKITLNPPRCSVSVKQTDAEVDKDQSIVEVNALLTVLKPAILDLKEKSDDDYLFQIPAEACTNLETLKLDFTVGDSSEWLIPALDKLEKLDSVQRLYLSANYRSEGHALTKPLELPAETAGSLKNVNTLGYRDRAGECDVCHPEPTDKSWFIHDDRRLLASVPYGFMIPGDLWTKNRLDRERPPPGYNPRAFWEQAVRCMPNVQMLHVAAHCDCAMEYMDGFRKLRHLVVTALLGYQSSAERFEEKMHLLEELVTLTVCFGDQPIEDVVNLAGRLVEVVAQAPNLKVVQVCCQIPADRTVIGVEEELRANIPKNLAELKLIVVSEGQEVTREFWSLEELDDLVH